MTFSGPDIEPELMMPNNSSNIHICITYFSAISPTFDVVNLSDPHYNNEIDR